MTEHTDTSLHDLVIRTFATVEAKDLEAMMSVFADDAVVIDPHFPTPQMQGKAVITEAFRGVMSGMRSFGYTIVNYFESENGQRAAVETATHHVVKQGIIHLRSGRRAHHEDASIRTVRATWDRGVLFVFGAPQKKGLEKEALLFFWGA